MDGKAKESLNVSPAYGVSSGPSIVAVQDMRLPSADGKAETPGAGEVISCINSVCNLQITKLATCPSMKYTQGIPFSQSHSI